MRLVGRPEQDRVEPHAVAIGARREVPAGLVGVAGLDAVQAGIGGQQRVAGLEAVAGDRDPLPPGQRSEERRAHVDLRQLEHVARRGVRTRLVEAVRRAVDGVLQAEPARFGVHEQDEARHGIARQRATELARRLRRGGLSCGLLHGDVRQHDGGVVGRVHDQRGQQGADGLALTELERNARLSDRNRIAARRRRRR